MRQHHRRRAVAQADLLTSQAQAAGDRLIVAVVGIGDEHVVADGWDDEATTEPPLLNRADRRSIARTRQMKGTRQ